MGRIFVYGDLAHFGVSLLLFLILGWAGLLLLVVVLACSG
jgi:hypothetical protein